MQNNAVYRQYKRQSFQTTGEQHSKKPRRNTRFFNYKKAPSTNREHEINTSEDEYDFPKQEYCIIFENSLQATYQNSLASCYFCTHF